MLLNVLFEDFLKKNDTQLMSLNSISKAKGEYGAQSAAEKYDEKRPRYIRITDINEDGSLNDDCVSSCNTNDDATYKLFYGDFLFARMGSVGKTYAFISGNQIFAGYLIRYQLDLEKIDPLYLLAFTKTKTFFNWVKLNQSGAIQPGINAKKYGELKVPVPTLGSQHILVNKIQQIKKTKATLQTMLEKLELLKKAKFKEMFGKDIAIKNKWRKIPLGSCCEINPQKPNDIADDYQCSFIPMASVGEHGEIDATCIKTYGEIKKGFSYFAENDVLFAKITPCMENGKGCIAHGLKNNIGFGSTEFHVLRPLSNLVNSGWIYFLTSSKEFRKIAELNMTGSAGQKRVSSTYLEQYQFYLPPIALQNKFVAYIIQIDKIEHTLQSALDKLTGKS